MIKDHVPGHLNPRHYTFRIKMDNYRVTRKELTGDFIAYDTSSGGTGFMMDTREFPDAEKMMFALDFGDSIIYTYVVAFYKNKYVILHEIKDLSDVGPKNTYHVVLSFNKEDI